MSTFLKFCLVGIFCTLLDAAVYYSLLGTVGYRMALASGYLLSLCVNYFLTVYWTFSAKATAGNAVGIVAAHLINLFGVRMGLMRLMVGVWGMDERVAYVPMLVVSVVTNYLIIRWVISRCK
jgi:putative flippase GtrA